MYSGPPGDKYLAAVLRHKIRGLDYITKKRVVLELTLNTSKYMLKNRIKITEANLTKEAKCKKKPGPFFVQKCKPNGNINRYGWHLI